MSPYETALKVFAMGARVCEVPLARPGAGAVEAGLANLVLPAFRVGRRRMFRRMRHCAVPGYSPLCMDTHDPDTVGCAFRQRLFRQLPATNKVMLEKIKAFVHHYCQLHLPVVQPMEFEEWLESTSYNEERKKQLRDEHDSQRGGRPSAHLCGHIDSFVKTEFYPTWKHARMINSRHDAFKVWSGPMFKAIENAVYTLPEFIKHTPVPERPALIRAMRQAGRRYFSTDFTAFESHFAPEVLEAIECVLYRHCLGNSSDADFLCRVISGTNRMRTRDGVFANVKGRRMSGDMCTSLGNGFTNLMLAKFIVAQKNGYLEGFVEGDDGLFCTNVELLPEDYSSLGFTMKIEEVQDPCEASFCGMVFSDSGEIIREPRRFMMGFGWTQSYISAGNGIMDSLLRAKALSTVYETPQCPIIGAFARYALKKTEGSVPKFIYDGYHVPRDVRNIPEFHPSYDTRLCFEREYGVSIPTQLLAEECISRGDFSTVGILIPPTIEQSHYSSLFLEPT